ncbi:outer membrane beta-barrel protein [Fulvimonas sp. R45]|uniref:outer membrane beta-barrel protein n=1 Tax=Fulvimonas sp. R45 TaxID=3045937 RepID=UPI00265FC48B|nr:outer membrane beta-barrel protein [Fulvimonas sp. R45]MDO1528472.1 outer membrane beta-barrel protein [Fulvimonas sp. R45]
MNKTLLALALAAGAAAVPAAFAQDATHTAQQGWYLSADAGYAHVNQGHYDDGAAAGGVKGGYRFAINPETSLGVEVGYQYLGRVKAAGAYNGLPGTKSKLRGSTAGLDLRYNFSPSWYGELRGGAFYAQAEGLTQGDNPEFRHLEKTKYYAGAGVGVNFSPNWSMGLNYDYYGASGKGLKLDPSVYTVSAEYRF